MLLKTFYREYVVITFQVVDTSAEDTKRLHSIVVKFSNGVALFDMNGLLEALTATSMEVLCPGLESKYLPWTYTSCESAFKKLNSIYRTLSRYTSRGNSTFSSVLDRTTLCPTIVERAAMQLQIQRAATMQIQMLLQGKSRM